MAVKRIEISSFLCDDAARGRRRLMGWITAAIIAGFAVAVIPQRCGESGVGRMLGLDRLSMTGWVCAGITLGLAGVTACVGVSELRFRSVVRRLRAQHAFVFSDVGDVLARNRSLVKCGQPWSRIIGALLECSTQWEGTLLSVDAPPPADPVTAAKGEAVALGTRVSRGVGVAAVLALGLGVAAAATTPLWSRNAGVAWLAAIGALACGALLAGMLLLAARRQGPGPALFSEVTPRGVTVRPIWGRARAYVAAQSVMIVIADRPQDQVGTRRLDQAVYGLAESREGHQPRYLSIVVAGRSPTGGLRTDRLAEARPASDADVRAVIAIWGTAPGEAASTDRATGS